MIRRLLALFGLALVSRTDAELLSGVKGFDSCFVQRVPLEQGALYVVAGIRPLTDEETMKAMGVKEGR
jgi:hypothetical protein